MSGDDSALPGCIGYYGCPDHPCEGCGYAQLCRHVKANFVAKAKLQLVLARLTELKQVLRR
jgi:hypothetical protein